MKYIGKNTIFRTKFRFKKNLELMNFEKLINYMGGHRWNIEKGLSQTLKICQMRRDLIYNVPKIRIKFLIPFSKVNIINFNYDILD